MKITLASSSKYRQQLLHKLLFQFDSKSPNIDESALKNENIKERVLRLAINKAQAISKICPENYVIGSDQLASFNGEALGKPGNFDNAKQQLNMLSGQTVQFFTGLCIAHHNSGQLVHLVDKYQVKFRPLTNHQINRYLTLEEPYDCAGSFKSEGLGISLFESLNGRDPNSLIGLPLIGLIDLFNQLNIDIVDYAHR